MNLIINRETQATIAYLLLAAGFCFKQVNMNTHQQQKKIQLQQKLLNEIGYRERVLKELRYDSKIEKGFVFNFMHNFLKSKERGVNPYWVDNEAYARFLIDADKELHNDIAIAFEKSIAKLKKEFNDTII